MQFVYGLITGLVLVGVGFLIYCRSCCTKGVCSCDKSVDEDVAKKAENLKKIEDFIADKEKFTNDDIEKLLGVSNTTTGRYLQELQDQGLIEQHGDTGKFVYYTKK